MSRYATQKSGFAFHAQAIGFSASLYKPVPENIAGQATVSLSQTGGESHSVIRNFDWKGIFSFDEAAAYVTGSSDPDQKVFSTLATVTVRGLNIANMITADRIIARVSSHHNRGDDGRMQGEGQITLEGSSFENLRIAGRRVNVKLNTECARQDFNGCTKFVKDNGGLTTAGGSASCSIATDVHAEDLSVRNGRIDVPDFGTIYLATVIFKPSYRRICMLRAELGCPIGGTVEVTGGEGNGTEIWQ